MLTSWRRRLAADDGLTLIELLIAMVVAAVVMGGVVNAMSQSTRAAQRNQQRITALAQLQTAAHRVSRELRAADPVTVADDDTVEVGINRSGETRIYRYQVVVDVPAAGSTPATYRLEEVRTVNSVASTFVLARGLDAAGLTLRYYQGSGVELSRPVTGSDLPLIQTIKLTLTRFIPMNSAPITLETTVDVRNQA